MNSFYNFLRTRPGKLVRAIAAFIMAWLLFLVATDSGSLQHWALTLGFLWLGLNSLYRSAFPKYPKIKIKGK